MKPLRAYFQGVLGLWRVKRYILGLYAVNLMLALALGSVVGRAIYRSLGNSRAAENLVQGFDSLWYGSFSATAQGLARTFHPAVVGIGAVFENLNDFLQGRLFEGEGIFLGLGLLYLLLWTFFSAGFISRFLSRAQTPDFWQAAAGFLGRLVLLAILAGMVYYLLLGVFLDFLSGWIRGLTRDTTDERIVFFLTLGKYGAVWFLVWWVNMVFDYSKIIIVDRNLRMVPLAPVEAFGLVLKHPLKTMGLYYLLGITSTLMILIYWMVAPGAGASSAGEIWAAFLLGQLYIILRMCLRVWFYSSQVALYEGLYKTSSNQSPEEIG